MAFVLTLDFASDKVRLGDQAAELTNNLVRSLRVNILIVVASEECSPVLSPEILLNLLDGRSDIGVLDTKSSNDVQPGDNGPEAVLLANVVATSTKTLLAADGELLGVEESTEELPAGGDLVYVKTLGLAYEVDGTGCRHGTGKTINTILLEVGNQVSMVGDDGQRIAGRDEGVGAVNHVTVTIAVRGCAKGNALLVNNLDKRVRVGEIGIGMAAVEVWAGNAVLGSSSKAKFLFENGSSVGTCHSVKGVEQDLEVGMRREELLDSVKVKDILEHGNVVGRAVNDLNLEATVCLSTNGLDVDIGDIG